MNRVIAAYQETAQGTRRVAIMRPRPGQSLRIIAEEFHRRHPQALHDGPLYAVQRVRIMGKWTDDRRPLPPPAERRTRR